MTNLVNLKAADLRHEGDEFELGQLLNGHDMQGALVVGGGLLGCVLGLFG